MVEPYQPCPVCGAPPHLYKCDAGCIVECDNTECWNQASYDWPYESLEEAKSRWNNYAIKVQQEKEKQ